MAMDPITLSIVTSLAASALYSGIQATAQKLSSRITDEEKNELRKVYKNAFTTAFAHQLGNLDAELRNHVGDILKQFVEDSSVSEQMISMALVDQVPDISTMTQWFHSQNYDLSTLPIDPESIVQSLVSNLADELQEAASTPESHLYNRVSIGLMKQIRTRQEAESSNPGVFELSRKTSRGLIIHSLQNTISRDDLLEELYQFSLSGNGVVVGPPGVGKSYLLYELSQRLINRGHACICLSVAGNQSRNDIKTALGISSDLVEYLGIAIPELSEEMGVVLIDGYDAARSTETRLFFRDLIAEFIRELHPRWHVIVSVRIYDARKSKMLLDLFPAELDSSVPSEYQTKDIRCRHIVVPLLTTEEVQDAVGKIGGLSSIYSNSSEDFRELLRFPFNLWLVERLLNDKPSLPELSAVTSETELLSLYWERRVEEHELAHQMTAILSLLTRNMVEHLNLVVRRETVFAFPHSSQVIDELLSIEMLRYSSALQQSFEFTHNVLFDYAVARLLIADNPDDFIAFFETDYFKPIFLLPSIEFYFSYLWLNQPDLFWQVFWKTYSSNVSVQLKLFARLIPPRIIVSQLERVDHLVPLTEALTNSSSNAPIAVAAVLRMLLARGVKQASIWSDFLNSIVHAVAREFVVDLAKITDELIKIGKDEANDEMLNQCGSITRSLADWVLTQRDSSTRGWIDRIGAQLIFPLVAKTFNTDTTNSRFLIERIVKLTKNKAVPLEYLSRLVDVFDEITVHDPELIADIYYLVFLSDELGDGSPFVGGIVVQLVMSAQSEREMLEHKLVWYYPRFLRFQPALATTVGMKCINHIVVRDQVINSLRTGVRIEDLIQRIHFHHGEAVFLQDHNYFWSSSRTPHNHEPMYMVESIFEYIEGFASDNKFDENNLNVLLSLFRDHAQVAYLWARLLQTASRYPEIFAVPLLELILNDEILYGDDTVYQLGQFLAVAPNFYSVEQMRVLEDAIVIEPKNVDDSRQREILEHRQKRLIAQIPTQRLVTKEALELRKKIEADHETYENQPLVSYSTYSAPYGEDEWLAEQGVNLQSASNKSLRELCTPLKNFKETWTNEIPDKAAVESVLPDVRKLYSILLENSVEAEDRVIDLAWTCLGECVERMCYSLKHDIELFDFFSEIVVMCACHHLPEPNPEYDAQYDTPSWSPSPRTSAAQALLTLAFYRTDEEVFYNITKLIDDPVPSVRYLISQRLFLTHHLSPDFFWESVRRVNAKENNGIVLQALFTGLLRQGIRETEEAQSILEEKLNTLVSSTTNEDLLLQIVGHLPWFMFVAEAEWATQAGARIKNNPVQLSKAFAHLTFRAMDPIKPDVIFSEQGKAVSQRAISWIMDTVMSAHGSIVNLLTEVKESGWTESTRNSLQDLQRVIGDVVNQIYFSADVRDVTGIPNDERALSDEERCTYYDAVKTILLKVSQLALDDTLGIIPAHTAHHYMELMNGVLYCDPIEVLHMSTNIAKSSKASGYQFDSMAVREVIKLVETLLADHQDKLKDNVALANLLELLDIFAEAGWSEALDLVGRLSEITR